MNAGDSLDVVVRQTNPKDRKFLLAPAAKKDGE